MSTVFVGEEEGLVDEIDAAVILLEVGASDCASACERDGDREGDRDGDICRSYGDTARVA